jgi:hypothetical protein
MIVGIYASLRLRLPFSMLQLAEMISDKRITADNIQDELARIHKVTDAAFQTACWACGESS